MALPRRRPSAAAAPKLTVKQHRPWPMQVAGLILVAILGAGLALWGWQTVFGNVQAERQALVEELKTVKESLTKETEERKRLLAIANSADSNLKVEQTTLRQLSDQVKTLEAENAKLKTDLSYFERLMPSSGREETIAIRSLEVTPDSVPNQMHYRALVTQGGREKRNFEGSLQIVLSVVVDGKPVTLVMPDPKLDGGKVPESLKLNFTRFVKVDGQVEIPAGAVLKNFQLRVLERGAIRAQQAVAR